MTRTVRSPLGALLTTTAFLAIATPALANPLNVPSGTTYTLGTSEAYDTVTGDGTVVLGQNTLTVGADGSSSTFNGTIKDESLTYVGSWRVFDGPSWSNLQQPILSGLDAAALIFGGSASDYRTSTAGNQISAINDRAWYDQYARPMLEAASNYKSDANGNGRYDQTGDSSAFIRDHGNTAVNYAFRGVAGGGALTKVGSGVFTLAGTGSWTGLTTISVGTLAGTSLSISGGSIVNNSALAYNQSFTGTVTQNISGSGITYVSGLTGGATLTFSGNLTNNSLQITDASSVILTGTNAFSGGSGVVLANGSTLTIAQGGSVSASNHGVFASTGAQMLNNQGTIDGFDYIGVRLNDGTVINGSASNSDALIHGLFGGISNYASLTVDNYGTIKGDYYNGLDASGAITLTNRSSGLIQGEGQASQSYSYGVLGLSSVAGTNEGTILGRFAGLEARGLVTLTNSGLIGSGTLDGDGAFVYSDGSDGVRAFAGGTVTNLAGGQILGSISGIHFAITGLNVANSGTVHGNTYGIYADAALTLTNSAGGIVSGDTTGLRLTRDGNSVVNNGSISGSSYGIDASGTASVTNNAGGSISGNNQAIYSTASGSITVTNAGDITGGVVSTNGGDLTVNNLAGGNIVRVVFGSAIDVSGGGKLTVTNAGDIVGSGWGVIGRNSGDSVDNSGRIASGTISGDTITVSGGDAVGLLAGGTVTNRAGGLIAGNNTGVVMGGTGTVANSGTITAANGDAVQSNSRLTVTNNAGATIDGRRIGVYAYGPSLTLTNSGSIVGRQLGGVYTGGGTNSIDNRAGGSITGTSGVYGLNLRGTNTVINAGTIAGQSAIYQTGGSLSVTNSGTLEGAVLGFSNGIYTQNAAVSVTNSGTILAHNTGNAVLASGGSLALVNLAGGVIRANEATNAWGVAFDGASGSVINAGIIDGGVGVYGGAASSGLAITNSGTITGTANGIALFGSGTITNNSGGVINGPAAGTAVLLSGGTYGLDLRAGSTVNGSINAAGATAVTTTLGGALNGQYVGSSAGIDTFTLAATGAMGSVGLAGGNDSFTTLGGAITGNVDGGAGTDSLTFNVAGSVTYAGNFTGFETGTKTGAGLVNLTGTNVIGTMAINAGTLAVNGSLSSNVTVSGGKLGGNGLITGDVVITSGGKLAPGNSIGTINVAGNLTLASGSTYEVEISPTASDLTNVSGNIAINGSALNILGGAGTYAPLTQYVILNAGGTVTGSFASVTDNLSFLDPTVVYTTKQVILQMRRNDIDFANVAWTPNQASTADALQSLPISTLYDAVLVSTAEGARQAYDALSGEVYASTETVLAQQGGRLRIALLDVDADGTDGFGLWADNKLGYSNFSASEAGSASLVADHNDVIAGLRWQGSGFSATAGGGIVRTDLRVAGRASSADIDSWMVGGQLAYRAGKVRVGGGFTYAKHDIDTKRDVVFPGFIDSTRSNRDATSRLIYGEAAYKLVDATVSVEPFVGLSRQTLKLDGTVEEGGQAALIVNRSRNTSTLAEVGVRIGGAAKAGSGSLYPVATLAWQHLMGDRRGVTTNQFVLGGESFSIAGANRSRDGLRVNAGLGYKAGAATIGVSYDGRFAGDTDHGVRFTAGVRF